MNNSSKTKISSDNIFTNMMASRKLSLPVASAGGSIKEKLEVVLANSIEGKCVVEGYVKRRTTKIQNYSSGMLNGERVEFQVVYECQVCNPVEGMQIECVARNITKAGIRATTSDDPSPVVIFVARDHHTDIPYFSTIKPEQQINVKVIGQRFELNDDYVSIIAEIVVPKLIKKKKLNIEN